jgi:tRNA-Thr(GGU) m(6)t(6)A37 methyltransferase TsaA
VKLSFSWGILSNADFEGLSHDYYRRDTGVAMSDSLPAMSLTVIGVVRNGVTRPPDEGWTKVISELVIEPGLSEALDNLDQFSHLIVLYWMHRRESRKVPLKVHPKGRVELPLVGLLATRSPDRPNPLGQTVVRLLERRGNVLVVEGLDAFDGTPVIDLKPYLPQNDFVAGAEVPPWITRE